MELCGFPFCLKWNIFKYNKVIKEVWSRNSGIWQTKDMNMSSSFFTNYDRCLIPCWLCKITYLSFEGTWFDLNYKDVCARENGFEKITDTRTVITTESETQIIKPTKEILNLFINVTNYRYIISSYLTDFQHGEVCQNFRFFSSLLGIN